MIERFAHNILWAQGVLQEHGYKILNKPAIVRSMPWSTVISFQTQEDFVYLKCMAKEFNYEASVLEFLNKHKFLYLPTIIATNNKNGSFLMTNAGTPLRLSLIKNYDTAIICEALKAYANLQIDCISHTNSLLAVGAKDLRLSKLPLIYKNFLLNERLLRFDGLTSDEIKILHDLSEVFQILCQTLEEFNIPETLEHGDFHDNNILLNKDKITINDFGDSAVSHPFFSIALLLNSSKRQYDLHDVDEAYVILQDCYLQEWKTYLGKDTIIQAFNVALLLHPFIWGLNLSRVESCTGEQGFPELHGHIAEQLRILINNMMLYKDKAMHSKY